jgi:hypothetical protein
MNRSQANSPWLFRRRHVFPAALQISDEESNSNGNSNGLVGVFAHHFIGGLRPGNGFIPDACRHGTGPFQGGGEPVAGFFHLVVDHASGRFHQAASVVSQGVIVVGAVVGAGMCMCVSTHMFYCYCLLLAFSNSRYYAMPFMGKIALNRSEIERNA